MKKIKTALISVFHKEGLDELLDVLNQNGVRILSTGGTLNYIASKNISADAVESLTDYPSILGGRVKTLHPKVFGGILARRSEQGDVDTLSKYEIPEIDLVVVDLYPFEETRKAGGTEAELVEKIDIGGISLIRAAAKNFTDTLVVSNSGQYQTLAATLSAQKTSTTQEQRRKYAAEAFLVTARYETAIFEYLNENEKIDAFATVNPQGETLRYGENPHQKGVFYGDTTKLWEKLNGKPVSYNNLLDIESALGVIADFDEPTVAVIKHNNTCGLSSADNLMLAWKNALAGDPVSAFGGVIAVNRKIDKALATEIDQLFLEVLIAPDFDADALEILTSKKNRNILKLKSLPKNNTQFRSLLNGVLWQEKDNKIITKTDLKTVTEKAPTEAEIEDLLFADKAVKHLKSNGIALVKNKMLVGMGCGHTSRVDALNHAITKAKEFGNDLNGAVMASDAFFPFPDCVEIAEKAGIKAVIQPGGSVKDELSIDFCNKKTMSMVFTGHRHFKH